MKMKFFYKGSKIWRFSRSIYYQRSIPPHISKNFITLNSSELDLINMSFDRDCSLNNIGNNRNYLSNVLNQRFRDHRMIVIPWLESVKPLKNAKILEVGCGHGTSTVSLAEQGAHVTAIDINEIYLQAAKTRCKVYGLNVEFHQLNAAEVVKSFSDRKFDFIIFWAVLEHMTLSERMQAMKDTFDMLPEGGLWCIIGTPNRLHFFDSHTSDLPFFHWLPDELAIKYSQNSKRQEYANCFQNYDDVEEEMLSLYRWGRGLSYHDIELAIKPLNELNIISTLQSFNQKRGFLSCLISKIYPGSQFELFLHKQYPAINRCFFQPYLNLIVKK